MSSYYTGSNGDDHSSYNPRVHARIAEKEGYYLAQGNEDPRTLWVGNLDPAITEEFIATVFNQMGAVTKAKLVFDFKGLSDPFAFIEFSDHNQASQALNAMNGRSVLDREIRVQWAVEPNQPGEGRKPETSRHFHVFVGDLATEIDSTKLKEAFLPFGEVSEAKIIRDTATNKAKGYGFVSYPRREDAERAIEQMNGQWLGRRTIRTNWASRKPDEEGMGGGERRREHREHRGKRYGERGGDRYEKSFEEIMNMTSPDNTSVYVGNIATLNEEEIRGGFDRFGTIIEVRIFKLQGYSFVKYEKKESAARAIVQMNNQEINGNVVRCSWGKASSGGNDPKGPSDRGGNYGYGSGREGGGGYGSGGPPPFGPGGGPPPGNGQNRDYWQYYAQYYNNPQLTQQWTNYWQNGGKGPAPGGPERN